MFCSSVMLALSQFCIRPRGWISSVTTATWSRAHIAVHWTPTLWNPFPTVIPVSRRRGASRCGHSPRPPSQPSRHRHRWRTSVIWIWDYCGANWPASASTNFAASSWHVRGRLLSGVSFHYLLFVAFLNRIYVWRDSETHNISTSAKIGAFG